MMLSKRRIGLTLSTLAIAGAVAGCGGSTSKNAATATLKGQRSAPAALNEESMQTYRPLPEEASKAAAAQASSVGATTVKLLVKADEEHAKKGPEGSWHDAYLPADFTVTPGERVTVHVYNYDEGKHSFTSPELGVNVTIAGGSEKTPKETTFTFTAPAKAGSYQWFCDYPCDPWAMAHEGFMQGRVTVS